MVERIEVRSLDSLSLANRSAYDYTRSLFARLPQDLHDDAALPGIRKAAFEERRHILRAAKTGETAFKDSKIRDAIDLHNKGPHYKHLRKTIRVVKLKGGRGYATVTGSRGARQSWLVNYGHPRVRPGPPHGARPHEFATSHIGKIDQQLIQAFQGEMDRLHERAIANAKSKAKANPKGYRVQAQAR